MEYFNRYKNAALVRLKGGGGRTTMLLAYDHGYLEGWTEIKRLRRENKKLTVEIERLGDILRPGQ